MSLLQEANQALRVKNYEIAIQLYEQLLQTSSPLKDLIQFNLDFAHRRRAEAAPDIADASIATSPPHVLFILPDDLQSDQEGQVHILARMLIAKKFHCTIATPGEHTPSKIDHIITRSFSQLMASGCHSSYDLVHAWSVEETVRAFTQQILSQHSCPLIVHLAGHHDSPPKKEQNPRIAQEIYSPFSVEQFLEQATALTMHTESQERLNTRNVPSLVLPPVVDERLFYPRPLNTALRQQLGLAKKHLVLACYSAIDQWNVDETAELYNAVCLLNQRDHPTTLLHIGHIAPHMKIPHSDNCHIKQLGSVPQAEVPDILAAADIFVHPGIPRIGKDHLIPLHLLGYFALGRPVVLPKTDWIPITDDQEAKLMDRADAQNIVREVSKIVRNKDLQQRLANNAVAFFLNSRDWMIDTLSFYRMVIS